MKAKGEQVGSNYVRTCNNGTTLGREKAKRNNVLTGSVLLLPAPLQKYMGRHLQ